MKRETRYLVHKLSDVKAHLDGVDRSDLARISEKLKAGRKQAGKPELAVVVVESDWPEYNEVWDAIERRVDGAAARVPVASLALLAVLQALNGEGHLIREMQFTRGPIVGDNNPINKLVDDYNAWVTARNEAANDG